MGTHKVEISLHASLGEIEKQWISLQERSLCTLYQTFEWCKTWQETIGKPSGIEPAIICASTRQGKIVFLLPFAIEKTMGIRLLRWYGANEITYGMGIYDYDFLRDNPDFIEALWPEIMASLGGIDSIQLNDQPEKMAGITNPLKFLFTERGANQAYKMDLQLNYQALFEQKRSASSRRKARRRDEKLADIGKVTFDLPEAGAETADVVNAVIEQQKARLGERGIRSVYDQRRQSLLLRLAQTRWQDGTAVLLPFCLRVDGKIVAVTLGGVFQSTYWALISSLTPDTSLYKFSPGDRALRETIQATCERGLKVFDFAAGDTEYKLHWNDEIIRLFETNKIVTAKGLALTTTTAVRTKSKRMIKQTPWLFSLAQSARKLLLGKKPK